VLYGGLRDRAFFCAPGEWTLQECANCGSCYLDPRPTVDTVSLAYSTYITHNPLHRADASEMGSLKRFRRALANGYRNWRRGTREEPSMRLGIPLMWFLPRLRAIIDSETRGLPRPGPGAKLLDIGCGAGAFLEWAGEAGWEAVGLDVDQAAVTNARSRGLDVRLGTVDVLDEQASFDAITMSHVIEHVHDPGTLLKRVRALLKPGGTFWVETPNMDSAGHKAFGKSWLGLDPPRHLVLFRPSSLRALINSAGLTIVETLSRFEVTESVYASSYRIARQQDPFGDAPVPLFVRMQARFAGRRARRRPNTTEFITILAAREE
jgi:2-polyprenyl-3-methyl-5-hydroxy-6-metoxy-1,4-benzoquinol methylase